MARRVVFQIGGFDEDLIYGEVEDVCLGTVRRVLWIIHRVLHAHMYHVPHPVD